MKLTTHSERKGRPEDLGRPAWDWLAYPGMSIEESELRVYENLFEAGLDARNVRLIKEGKKDRVMTMEEYYSGEKSCPEETLYMIGKAGDTVGADVLKKACIALKGWEIKRFSSNIGILDIALYTSPVNAPMIRERKVWYAKDEDGHYIVSQSRALEALGISRPYPDKPQSRYNNPKMVYSKMIRDRLIEICHDLGIVIEQEEKPAENEDRIQELEAENRALRDHIADLENKLIHRS